MSITPTEDSRQIAGTLSLGGIAFAKQAYSVDLTPNVSADGDKLDLLNGNTLSADEKTDWDLNVGAVQDFDDPDGFLEYCRANAGETVAFIWEPNATDAPTFSGTLTVRAMKYGGPVRVRLTSEVTFPVVTLEDPVYPA